MAYNGDSVVDEIKNRCNIVDVIGRVVTLKKAGANYKGLCPFHNEKTPSFMVSEDKQIFNCFGCGTKGDVIEFVQKYYNLDFHGALEKLAAEYGIDISRSGFGDDNKRAALYELNREAAAFFYRNFTTKANPGYAYMAKRGIEPATMRKFGIGYAEDDWNALRNHFEAKNADKQSLIALGLLSSSKGKDYDKFRDRVMFPIINTRGKVIGFGGRAIGDGTPKYLNSPESIVFQKKNNLYGLNLTRTDISREDCAILVEGYMDVISLYQHGVRNVSASLGTALTENQAAMLKRYTNNVVLCYDADEAGQNAALRGMDILHKAGFRVKVFHVSDGKDPDEFIKKNGKEAFLKLVKNALPFADYKISLLRKKLDLSTTEGNVTFLRKAAEVLRQLSPVEADVYIRRIAEEYRVSEGALRREVEGGRAEETPRRREETAPAMGTEQNEQGSFRKDEGSKGPDSGEMMIQRNLIRLMLEKSSYVPLTEPYRDVFTDPACYRIFSLILSSYKPDRELDLLSLTDSLDPQDAVLLQSINRSVRLAGHDVEIFKDCIRSLDEKKRSKREKEIITLLSVLDDEKDRAEINQLTLELMELQKQKNKGGWKG